MTEINTTLKRLTIYFIIIIAVGFVVEKLIPNEFPVRNISSLVYPALAMCLLLYNNYRTPARSGIKHCINAISAMMLALVLLRGIKYSIYFADDAINRYTWYAYYIPLLFIPLLLYITAVFINEDDESFKLSLLSKIICAITVVIALIVLTNDTHQWVFGFKENFADWDSDYTHELGFIILTIWEYLLYVVAVAIMLRKSSISSTKQYKWLILVPFTIGIAMQLLLFTDNMIKFDGLNMIEFPEAVLWMVVGVLECCMQFGLIPTNEGYRRIMEVSSISAEIRDAEWNIVYSSKAQASPVGERTILTQKIEIPGGYGIWHEDVTELAKQKESLAEIREQLSEESELLRLQNELKARAIRVEQRSSLYDKIAEKTSKQALAISEAAEKKQYKHILIWATYIKRYANLMLLADEDDRINAGELCLAVAESLKYTNNSGIHSDIMSNAECLLDARDIITAYEKFEELIEINIDRLIGIYANISESADKVVFKLVLEGSEIASLPGVETEREGGTCFACIKLPKGGEPACN